MDDSTEPMDQLTAHLDRGWDLAGRGDLAGAMLSAEKSLELNDESPEAHNLLGYVLMATGRADEALEQFRSALELDDGYVDAMLNAAEVLFHPLRDYDEALRMAEEAVDWLEEDEHDLRADALLIRFDVALARGEREEAERVARLLPAGPFENPQLYLQVGRARFEVGDVAGAEPLVRRAVDESPPMADAYYYMGLILEAQDDRRGALVGLLTARDLDLAMPMPPWALARDQFERRVQSALQRLQPAAAAALEGALVVVSDVPGAEVVADGVDPRLGVLLDDLSTEGPPRVGRIFLYQRNVERMASGLLDIEDEIVRSIEHEMAATFPELPITPSNASE
jgi:tetratricopeptide (TPR) repeat protein